MDLYLIAEYTVPFDSLDVNVVLELHELAEQCMKTMQQNTDIDLDANVLHDFVHFF